MDGEELAAQIAADPDDDAAYLVYADWLQSQNDPLGKLIIFDHRLANGEDIGRQRWDYLEANRHYLLGKMAHRADVFERSPRKLGFLRTVPRGNLAGWLSAPVSRFALTIIAEDDIDIAALAAAPPIPSLRHLALRSSFNSHSLDLSSLWPRIPHLVRFEFEGSARLGAIELPNVRGLRLGDHYLHGLDTETVAAVARASWPALEALRIGFVGDDQMLAPLLDDGRAPRLTELGFRRYWDSLDALATMLADAPIVSQLRNLAISSSQRLEGAGATAIANAAARFRHLETFDVPLGKRVKISDRQILTPLFKPAAVTANARSFADRF